RSEFDITKTTILHRGDKPFLSDVLAELSMEENRLCPQRETEENVLDVSRPGNNMKPYRPPQFNKSYEDYNKKVICFYCREPGHVKTKCPKLRRFEKRVVVAEQEDGVKNGIQLKQLTEALQTSLQSFFKGNSSVAGAMTASTQGMTSWLLDSGASFH
ncbi:hypothetical protein QML37_31550, partial [Klebsiella pneumoniae]|uniref:hypothetical protein n=1 Tax=Klebsiella pneumoniae TaxID=573 RepID=UPI003A7F9F04